MGERSLIDFYYFIYYRLGILVDFLSRSTITGFMGGTACIIILQQMKGMLGMTHFTTKTDLVSVLHAIFHNRHEVSFIKKKPKKMNYFLSFISYIYKRCVLCITLVSF